MVEKEEIILASEIVPLIARKAEVTPIVLSVNGNVASGKSTFAKRIKEMIEKLDNNKEVCVITTDDFLLSNQQLHEMNLFVDKGFPNTYNYELINRFVNALLSGEDILIPQYDHKINDIDFTKRKLINHPDIIILEGLISSRKEFSQIINKSIFINVNEKDNYEWYLRRCLDLNLPALYDLSVTDFLPIAKRNWKLTNWRNFIDNVLPLRSKADIQVYLDHNHQIWKVEVGTMST